MINIYSFPCEKMQTRENKKRKRNDGGGPERSKTKKKKTTATTTTTITPTDGELTEAEKQEWLMRLAQKCQEITRSRMEQLQSMISDQ